MNSSSYINFYSLTTYFTFYLFIYSRLNSILFDTNKCRKLTGCLFRLQPAPSISGLQKCLFVSSCVPESSHEKAGLNRRCVAAWGPWPLAWPGSGRSFPWLVAIRNVRRIVNKSSKGFFPEPRVVKLALSAGGCCGRSRRETIGQQKRKNYQAKLKNA